MYIKSQVGSGHVIQKVYGDDIFVRNDVMNPDECCSDVAFRDIWGNGKAAGENGNEGCPLVQVTENMSQDCHEDGSRTVVVAYFLNEHDCLQAVVCDSVIYIMSDDGNTLAVHRA